MHEALVSTHRTIMYSLCQYGVGSVWEWGPKVGGNLWRTTDDIRDNFRSMALIGFSQSGLEAFAGPGHWNDPDMLEVGNGGMKPDEYRTQMSLWSMLAAPLLAGNDLNKMDEDNQVHSFKQGSDRSRSGQAWSSRPPSRPTADLGQAANRRSESRGAV